jgi:hypothetical protein
LTGNWCLPHLPSPLPIHPPSHPPTYPTTHPPTTRALRQVPSAPDEFREPHDKTFLPYQVYIMVTRLPLSRPLSGYTITEANLMHMHYSAQVQN